MWKSVGHFDRVTHGCGRAWTERCGLQNRCGAAFVVPGGFDSLALPPPNLILNEAVSRTSACSERARFQPEAAGLTATVTATRTHSYGRAWTYGRRIDSIATAASRCMVGVTWL